MGAPPPPDRPPRRRYSSRAGAVSPARSDDGPATDGDDGRGMTVRERAAAYLAEVAAADESTPPMPPAEPESAADPEPESPSADSPLIDVGADAKETPGAKTARDVETLRAVDLSDAPRPPGAGLASQGRTSRSRPREWFARQVRSPGRKR